MASKANVLLANPVHPALLNFSPRRRGWLIIKGHTAVGFLPAGDVESLEKFIRVNVISNVGLHLVALLKWSLSFP